MSPVRIEFDLGQNIHGQPLRLVKERTTGGRMAWTLYRDEANQRDDRSSVGGLTSEVILKMAEAVKNS